MDVRLEHRDGLRCTLALAAPAAEVDRVLDQVAAECDPGRGDEALAREAADRLVDAGLAVATERYGLRPVNRVQVENGTAGRGREFACTLHLEVLPDIPLPEDFAALAVEVEEPLVQPGELREHLHRLLRARGRLETVDEARLPRDGDVLDLDVDASWQGRPTPGMHAEHFLLQLRPDPEESAVAALARRLRAGETGAGTLPCPPDYPDAALRGRMLDLSVRLHAIRREVLPAPDAALAAALGFADAKQLLAAVYRDCFRQKLDRVRRAAERKLLAAILDGVDFPLPESLLHIHLRTCLLEARRALARAGLAGEALERELERAHAAVREEARALAREQALLLALAYRERLAVTGKDVDDRVRELAGQAGQSPEQLRRDLERTGAVHELQDRLLAEKALEFLFARARKITVDAHGNPVPAARPKPGVPAD